MDSFRNFRKESLKYQNGMSDESALISSATKVLDEIMDSDFYQAGQKELHRLYSGAKKRLAHELKNLPDLPMGKLLFLAPMIKSISDKLYCNLENNAFQLDESDDYWDINYLLDMFLENVPKECIWAESPLSTDAFSYQDIFRKLSITMEKIVSEYPSENTDVYNGYFNTIFALTLLLTFKI